MMELLMEKNGADSSFAVVIMKYQMRQLAKTVKSAYVKRVSLVNTKGVNSKFLREIFVKNTSVINTILKKKKKE